MKNTLSFVSINKSIVNLSDTELPGFVVLTGRNGSGKTHLLEAIKRGSVKSDLISDLDKDVLLYDWNNIIPQDTGIFNPSEHQSQRSNWFAQIRSQQDRILPKLQQDLIELGIPAQECSTIDKINSIDEARLEAIFGEPAKAALTYDQLKAKMIQHGKSIGAQTHRHIADEYWKKLGPEITKEKPELYLETSESSFFSYKKLLWGEVDPFQQAFGRVFSVYRDLIHQNDRLEKYPPRVLGELKHLDEASFLRSYGEPPWDFVNRILDVCNLDFRVDGPPLHEVSSYEPRLRKVTADVEMRFKDLSSGEKVLMSFALCLYNANDIRQQKQFPKLLLLDEVDAPLHPSMVLSLLKTIQEVLINGKGISVILTTHSPSTVALAPEESLFEMNPVGPSIDKITKSRALSILTTGVPTLSVSFDGRRQVFVESRTDAQIYDNLYQSYKSYLASERSLNFVEVGKSDESGGEKNAGCAQVERLVNALVSSGNSSVFGLVDWDGSKQSTSRIKVLSCAVRDGVESLLFDPVLITATVMKENLAYCREKNIVSEDDVYISLGSWEVGKWQNVVNLIQDHILGERKMDQECLEIEYLNGLKLKIRKDYLHMDDHGLQGAITSAFGFLVPKNKRAGSLMNHIHSSVLSDNPKLIPLDLIKTFKEILEETV